MNTADAQMLEQLRAEVVALRTRLARAEVAGIIARSVDVMLEGLQILSADFRYLYLNDTAVRHAQRARDDLLGRTMMECYPGIENTEMFRILGEVLHSGLPHHFENAFSYPDGKKAWFELHVERVPEGLLVLSSDITERKRAAEDLMRSKQELAATLDCMADAVLTTDLEGRVLTMNPAAEALLGYTYADAFERPLRDLVSFCDQKTGEPVPPPIETILARGQVQGLANSTLLSVRGGAMVPIASSGAPLRTPDGDVCGVVLALKNMTREYALLSELQHAQKLEAVGRLAGGVAHDFNNALSVIITLGSLAQMEAGDPAQLKADLEQIVSSADHAAGLTRQLLAFSHRQVSRPQVIDLSETIHNLSKMLKRVLPENIDLAIKTPPGLCRVHVDAGQLEQVIMNLVVNAADAMPDGGRLTLSTANAEVDGEYGASEIGVPAGQYVVLAVSDDGHGMDAETQKRIFEPFFTTKGLGKGTGLGLSTVYGIVKQSGGNVWVYSEVGKGTTFKVYLPATDAVLEPAVLRTPRARTGQEVVLLVEDDAAVRLAAARILEREGYEVLLAETAAEAKDLCRQRTEPIHLLLTDIRLRDESGPHVAQALVKMRPSLKVVFMSGYAPEAMTHQGVLAPEAHFVEKPFSPDTLAARLRESLDAA